MPDTEYCPCCGDPHDCECIDECLKKECDHECFFCQETLDEELGEDDEANK